MVQCVPNIRYVVHKVPGTRYVVHFVADLVHLVRMVRNARYLLGFILGVRRLYRLFITDFTHALGFSYPSVSYCVGYTDRCLWSWAY